MEAHDSMWLQTSFDIPDPVPSEPKVSQLKKSTLPLSHQQEPEQETILAPKASALSQVNINSQKRDSMLEVKNRASQVNRERFQLQEAREELERTKAQLCESKDELKVMQEIVETEKNTCNVWKERATQEVKRREESDLTLKQIVAECDNKCLAMNEKMKANEKLSSEEIECMKARFQELSEEMECQHEKEMASLQKEHQHQSTTLIQRTSEAATLEDEVAKLNEQVSSLKEQLSTKTEELEMLSQSFVASSKKAEEINRLRLEDMQSDCEKQIAQVKSGLQAKIVSLEEAHQATIDGMQVRVSQGEQAETEVKKLQRELFETEEKLNEQICEKMKEIQQLHDEKLQLRVANDESMQKLKEENTAQLESRQKAHEETVGQLTEEKSTLKQEYAALKDLKETLEESFNSKAQVIAELRTEIAQLEESKETLSEEKQVLEQVVHQAQNEVKDTAAKLEAVTLQKDEHITELNGQIADVKAERDETEIELNKQIEAMLVKNQELSSELSAQRAAFSKEKVGLMSSETAARKQLAELTRELDDCRVEKSKKESRLEHVENELMSSRTTIGSLKGEHDLSINRLEEVRGEYITEKQQLAEKNIEIDELRRRVKSLETRGVSQSPAPLPPRTETTLQYSPPKMTAQLPEKRSRKKVRSDSPSALASEQPRSKRPRLGTHVVAITGFSDKSMLDRISTLPTTTVVDSRSNGPISPSITHLIVAGQLTIKLLTAVVRGCWILPDKYISDSLSAGEWMDESEYGFRHEQYPLQGKNIAFTNNFRGGRHFSTAHMVVVEGGAVECEAAASDIVLCHPIEVDDYPKGMTWDAFVKMLYPRNIC